MTALAVLALASCSVDVTALELLMVDERTLHLSTECAWNVSADISETDSAVRVDDISADSVDGDCQHVIEIHLDAPLGERDVIIDNKTWERIDDDCDRAVYADIERVSDLGWELPLPCDPAVPARGDR